jgi:L-rhamnonate dehydratase
MRISDLLVHELTGEFEPEDDPPQERQADPLDVYPEFRRRGFVPPPRTAAAKVVVKGAFVEVRTDEGVSGTFGPIDATYAVVARREMRDFLPGRDPLATEQLWDMLLRRNRHGRAGYYLLALSAVDCALWDLKGKAFGVPVYRLLGGPTRDSVPAYASMLGASLEPEAVRQRAAALRAEGYCGQKWFLRHGPGDGAEGAARNLEVVRAAREGAGEDMLVMLDAFNAWDLPYAVSLARRMAPCRPYWLEEPVPVDRLDALRAIREQTGIAVATGEHATNRWEIKRLLDAGAVDFVQPDPDWCGGITELLKIAALSSAYDVPLCPHGRLTHAPLHFAAAMPPGTVPMMECIVLHQPARQRFLKGFLGPVAGAIPLPTSPGLGIEIDWDLVESHRMLE